MVYSRRDTCRACGEVMRDVLDLGTQYLAGQFVLPNEAEPPRVPLEVCRCGGCGLVQLRHTVEPDLMFRRYGYRSGVTATMRNHLKELAAEAKGEVSGRSVLDIGCNDGTLLKEFSLGWNRVGVDPSVVTAGASLYATNDHIAYVQDFFPSPHLVGERYDLITSVACLYDADDPVAFAKAIADHLRPGGLWCVEVADLSAMVANGTYDAICHEHLCYYDLESLIRVAEKAGLRLKKWSRNGCNGGSIRAYFGHAGDGENVYPYSPMVTDAELKDFVARVHRSRRYLAQLVAGIVGYGQTIHLLGASTKVGTVLQYCGLTVDEVPAASDRDPLKHGKRIAGTGIPIVGEEESRAAKPDYYLVGPWHFRKEIVARERAAGTKAKFLWTMMGTHSKETVCV